MKFFAMFNVDGVRVAGLLKGDLDEDDLITVTEEREEITREALPLIVDLSEAGQLTKFAVGTLISFWKKVSVIQERRIIFCNFHPDARESICIKRLDRCKGFEIAATISQAVSAMHSGKAPS